MTRFYLIQSDVVWEQPEANRQQFTACITGCTDGVIVLPEMFSMIHVTMYAFRFVFFNRYLLILGLIFHDFGMDY